MKIDMEFDVDIPFDMQFGDWLPASPVSPDAVLYTEQSLALEHQAQARKNIDAMQNGVADTDLDMQGHGIDNASHIILSKKLEMEGADFYTAFEMSCGSKGDGSAFVALSDVNGNPVRITGVADGTTDSDAATCGQLWDAIGETEQKANRVTTIDENADDEHYPTAKAVYDYVQNAGGGGENQPETEETAEYFGICTQVLSSGYLVNTSVADTKTNSRIIFCVPVKEGDIVTVRRGTAWTKDTFQSEVAFTTNENLSVQYNDGVSSGYRTFSGVGYSLMSPCDGLAYVGFRYNSAAPSTWGVTDGAYSDTFTIMVNGHYCLTPFVGVDAGFTATGKKEALQPSWNGILSIHRGWATAPDNTLQAFWLAKQYGYVCCEIDIRETSDGVLVLSHDDTITGKVNGVSTTYTISAETYETLTHLRYDNENYPNCPVCKFEDALSFARRVGLMYLLDFKIFTTDFTQKVVNLVRRYGMLDNVIFFCWGHIDMMDVVFEAYPKANFAVNEIPEDNTKYDKYLSDDGKFIIAPSQTKVLAMTHDQWNTFADKGYLLGAGEVTYQGLGDILTYNPYYVEPGDSQKSKQAWYARITDHLLDSFDIVW